MNKIIIMFFVFSVFLTLSLVSAVPVIQIHSPENIAYDSTKILVNVTSNEPVDFFFKNPRTDDKMILAENSTSLDSFIYVKKGSYNFTIWAENSNGVVSESVVLSSSVLNPISVDSCGFLYSSDAKYVLINDISTTDYQCIGISGLTNVSFNLNGNTINSGYIRGLLVGWSSNVEVYNGTITGSPAPVGGARLPWILDIQGTKLRFKDLDISGFIGIEIWSLQSVIFENVFVNSSIGVWFETLSDVYFINSTFVWNGVSGGADAPFSSAFWAYSDHSNLVLEEVTIEGFLHDIYLEGAYIDFYFRNTNVNLSSVYYPDWVSNTRFYRQHKILVNVKDQFNETGSGVIDITDNGLAPRKSGIEATLAEVANPTSSFLSATNENGTTSFWLTEKLTFARTASPPVVTEYDFSPYNLTARSWNSTTTSQLSLSGVNSTIPINFKILVPKELPPCTLYAMLDLNNDNSINILDAILILRYITGKEVGIGAEKNCEAKGLFVP